jgi:hypothetical protein
MCYAHIVGDVILEAAGIAVNTNTHEESSVAYLELANDIALGKLRLQSSMIWAGIGQPTSCCYIIVAQSEVWVCLPSREPPRRRRNLRPRDGVIHAQVPPSRLRALFYGTLAVQSHGAMSCHVL